MMALPLRLRRLSGPERRLLLEASLALGVARLAIALLAFKRLTGLALSCTDKNPSAEERAGVIGAVRWAVLASARRLPWRTKCLEQAFAAHWLLWRRGVCTTIHYGVANGAAGLSAHAWVRAGSSDVIGCENSDDFVEVARFPGAV